MNNILTTGTPPVNLKQGTAQKKVLAPWLETSFSQLSDEFTRHAMRHLKDAAIRVYLAILSHVREHDSRSVPAGMCFPGEETLAAMIGRSVDTVQRGIKQLVEVNMLAVHARWNNWYELLAPSAWTLPSGPISSPQCRNPAPTMPQTCAIYTADVRPKSHKEPEVMNQQSSPDLSTSFSSEGAKPDYPRREKLSEAQRENYLAILAAHRFEEKTAKWLVRRFGPRVGLVPAWWEKQAHEYIECPQAVITQFIKGELKESHRKRPQPAHSNAAALEPYKDTPPPVFVAECETIAAECDAWENELVEPAVAFDPKLYVGRVLDDLEDGLPIEEIDCARPKLLELDEWGQVKALVLAKWQGGG